MAICAFLIPKAYKYPSPHPRVEAHDPMKFLHVYGYGCCDDFSTVFYTICQAIGIPARVISLDEHAVSEIKYNGKWRLFDVYQGEIYRNYKGEIVGVTDIEENPSLLDNPEHLSEPYELTEGHYNVDRLKEIYGNRNINTDMTWYYKALSSSTHKIAIHLRPGEAINFNFETHVAVFRSCNSPNFPPIFGNGTIRYTPFMSKQAKDYMVNGNSLSYLDETGAGVVLTNTSDKKDIFEIPFTSSFPLLRGWMNIDLRVVQGKVIIECSHDKKTWTSIWSNEDGNTPPKIADFSGQFINFDGKVSVSDIVRVIQEFPSGKVCIKQDPKSFPCYNIFVRFRLLQGAKVVLNNLEITLLFQFAPLNLPVLSEGKNNIKLNLEGKGVLTMSQIEGGDICAY